MFLDCRSAAAFVNREDSRFLDESQTQNTLMSGSKFVYVTYIRITPEKLWHALTTPEIIKQYRFGMSFESEWNVGSRWRMYADGSLMDSGEILESVSQKRLVMSWLCEWKPEFKAEGNSRCVYELEPRGRPRSSHSPIRLNGRT